MVRNIYNSMKKQPITIDYSVRISHKNRKSVLHTANPTGIVLILAVRVAYCDNLSRVNLVKELKAVI